MIIKVYGIQGWIVSCKGLESSKGFILKELVRGGIYVGGGGIRG